MSDASHRDIPAAAPSTAARSPNANRRRFLMFGAGAAGAAAAAPVLAAPAAVVDVADPKRDSQGYRETAHVSTYYATTRF